MIPGGPHGTFASLPLVEEHLFLAELIAFDYANIPGCRWDEARSEASMALLRASKAYDPSKGEFAPFASRAIRNALNSLYAKQLRMLRIFPASLDDPISRIHGSGMEGSADAGELHSRQDVRKEVRESEAARVLASLLGLLSPRERMIVEGVRIGRSYTEIGEELGISKQAAHKSARAGLHKLREGLERLGYRGLASDGLLGSRHGALPRAQVDDFSAGS